MNFGQFRITLKHNFSFALTTGLAWSNIFFCVSPSVSIRFFTTSDHQRSEVTPRNFWKKNYVILVSRSFPGLSQRRGHAALAPTPYQLLPMDLFDLTSTVTSFVPIHLHVMPIVSYRVFFVNDTLILQSGCLHCTWFSFF